MSGYTLISQAFGEAANLYTDVLGIPSSKNASDSFSSITPSQLRKAYYKRALEFHPDKQSTSSCTEQEIEMAKLKFQAVSLAYTILSNPNLKQEYDESGHVWDEDSDFGSSNTPTEGFDMWTEYFRGIFGGVTTQDIDNLTLQYKCSDEEQRDVLQYYKKFKGDLKKMLECVMCSSEIDMKRWVEDYITPAIRDQTVPDYMEKVLKTLVVVNHADNEEEEEEDIMDEDGDDDDSDDERTETDEEDVKSSKNQKVVPKGRKSKAKTVTKKKSPLKSSKNKRSEPTTDLIAAIQGKAVTRRKEAFGDLMSSLETRYGGGGGIGKKSNKRVDIPDDEFEAIRSNLGTRRKDESSSKSRR
jgi:curved DNA-binding protein CbpA